MSLLEIRALAVDLFKSKRERVLFIESCPVPPFLCHPLTLFLERSARSSVVVGQVAPGRGKRESQLKPLGSRHQTDDRVVAAVLYVSRELIVQGAAQVV